LRCQNINQKPLYVTFLLSWDLLMQLTKLKHIQQLLGILQPVLCVPDWAFEANQTSRRWGMSWMHCLDAGRLPVKICNALTASTLMPRQQSFLAYGQPSSKHVTPAAAQHADAWLDLCVTHQQPFTI